MPLLGVDGRGVDGSVNRESSGGVTAFDHGLVAVIHSGEEQVLLLISGSVLLNHRLTTAIPMGRGSLRFNFL